jgi:hypothetical protein
VRYLTELGSSEVGGAEGMVDIAPAYLILSESAIQLGRLSEAEQYLSQVQWLVLQSPTSPPSLLASLSRNLGQLATARGRLAEARRHFAEDVRSRIRCFKKLVELKVFHSPYFDGAHDATLQLDETKCWIQMTDFGDTLVRGLGITKASNARILCQTIMLQFKCELSMAMWKSLTIDSYRTMIHVYLYTLMPPQVYQSSVAHGTDSPQAAGGYFHMASVFFREGRPDIATSLHDQVHYFIPGIYPPLV